MPKCTEHNCKGSIEQVDNYYYCTKCDTEYVKINGKFISVEDVQVGGK